MTVELIRLKITRPGAAPLQLYGSVIVRCDGTADFFGDAAEHAKIVGKLLDEARADLPFGRVTLEDLESTTAAPSLLVDVLRLDGQRIIGPLLLRRDHPPTVGGEIDAAAAARTHRVLQGFYKSRAVRQAQAAAA